MTLAIKKLQAECDAAWERGDDPSAIWEHVKVEYEKLSAFEKRIVTAGELDRKVDDIPA